MIKLNLEANTEEEKSPLNIRVEKLSKQISMLVLGVAIIITVLLITWFDCNILYKSSNFSSKIPNSIASSISLPKYEILSATFTTQASQVYGAY